METKLHLTHALILTNYETIVSPSMFWNDLSQADYAVHCLYCTEADEILYLNDNVNAAANECIAAIKSALSLLGYDIIEDRAVKVVGSVEEQYSIEAVKKCFHF